MMGVDTSKTTTLNRRALVAGLGAGAALLASGPATAQRTGASTTTSAVLEAPSEKISVSARRIKTFSRLNSDTVFGSLTFLGGLVLSSPAVHFGGFSGLVVAPDGRGFLAISDEGHWLSGLLTYDGASVSGMDATLMGPIVAMSGKSLWRKRDQDCEAVALAEGTLERGTVLMAFERNHRIGRFPIVNRVVGAPTGYLKMPPETKRMGSNRGFEAMTVMTGGPYKGSVIAICERFPDPSGQHTGWLWIGGEPQKFSLVDKNGFEITDAVSLGDGSLLILERRFRWTEGVKMQIRRVPAAEIRPGGMLDGTLLIEAGMSAEIDNMEGLAVHQGPHGKPVLTLISDDNFNALLQRTILLQFEMS